MEVEVTVRVTIVIGENCSVELYLGMSNSAYQIGCFGVVLYIGIAPSAWTANRISMALDGSAADAADQPGGFLSFFGSSSEASSSSSPIGGPEGYKALLRDAKVREDLLRAELRTVELEWEFEHGTRRAARRT